MLTKKERKKRYNKPVKNRVPFQFDGWGQQTKKAFENNPGGAVAGITGAASGAIQAGIENATLQGVEEAQAEINKRSNFTSTANTAEDLLSEMAASVDARTNYTKNDFMLGSGEMAMNAINAGLSGAASGAAAGPWGAIAGAAAGLLGGGIGAIVGHAKANKTAKNLNEKARQANLAKSQALISKVNALDQANDQRAMAAYAAYGGGINNPKFSDYPSEVTEFNTGGSHEENPYDGIPQGIAPDGLPNLVEEGEVKYDNYIFSDRLMLNKNDKKKYKFLKGKTYADAAKAIKKELGIDERPNDLIAKADLEEQLNLLSMLQEEERAKRGLRGENRMMYAKGGHLFPGDDNNPGIYVDEDAGPTPHYGKSWYPDDFNHIDSGTRSRVSVSGWPEPQQPKKGKFSFSSLLQAAPAIGNAIGVLTQAFNRPDYKHAKELQQSNEKFTPISYTPLTQRMVYKPFDVNYYGNKLGAQAGATRRAITEQTATNPYAATAALLTADANAQGQLGDLYKKAEEYNLAQREKVDTFNRATDQANAEMAMKAQQLNTYLQNSAYDRQFKRDAYAQQMKQAEDDAWSKSMSASMTGLFDNLGAMGKEKMFQTQGLLKLIGDGITYKPEMKPLLIEMFGQKGADSLIPILEQLQNKETPKEDKKAYGGRIRKKKGYTI